VIVEAPEFLDHKEPWPFRFSIRASQETHSPTIPGSKLDVGSLHVGHKPRILTAILSA
jgi:hypothetical protein